MVGDIFLAAVTFTDNSGSKVRPVLLLRRNSYDDMLFVPLTTNLSVKGIPLDNIHLSAGQLPKPSMIITEKIGVVAQTQLIRKLATVDQSTYAKVIAVVVAFISGSTP